MPRVLALLLHGLLSMVRAYLSVAVAWVTQQGEGCTDLMQRRLGVAVAGVTQQDEGCTDLMLRASVLLLHGLLSRVRAALT